MVKCVSEVQQPNQRPIVHWIGSESDQLAPVNSMTMNEKRKINQIYQILYKSLQN
jgi:hypothetical protein